MEIQRLGHVVLKVRDLARSEAFYEGILGFRRVARPEGFNMTFYSIDDHHNLAIAAVGDGPDADDKAPGLLHVAFKIGDSTAVLRAAKEELEGQGLHVVPIDHGVSQSLYLDDPDGNTIELYVDTSDIWKRDPSQVAQSRPLDL